MNNLGPAYLRDNVRKNSMYWWLGQVVDEDTWIGNEQLHLHSRDAVSGWGKRYRVRIFSRDSEVKIVPDEQLDMADVVAPVTAGSGHGGYGETVVLAQGSFVMGFYLDGEEGRQPIIFGTLPNNPQTRLFGGDPEDGFIPRTGFMGITGNKKVATHDLYTKPGSHPCKEGCTADGALDDVKRHDQKTDGDVIEVRKKNIECEGGGGPIQNIQGFIQKALSIINFLKSQANSFLGAASDLKNNIQNIVDSTASFVASMFKLIVGRMREFALKEFNKITAAAGQLIPPNLRQVFATKESEAAGGLGCVIQKIIDTLLDLAKGFIEKIVDGFVVAPICAAEKMVGDMIGNIIGDITSGIESALSGIENVIGAAADIASGAFEVLDFITGLLNFLKCDETPNCKYTNRWSFWNGENEAAEVSEELGDLLKEVAGSGGGGGGGECSTTQVPCDAPTLTFTNMQDEDSEISAECIVSADGQVMGCTFSDTGGNLSATPGCVVNPNNNSGGGCQIALVTTAGGGEPSTTIKSGGDVEIVGAIVLEPGQGYLQAPDGSSTFPSDPNDVIIRDTNGSSFVVPPNTGVGGPGDEIQLIQPNTNTDPNSNTGPIDNSGVDPDADFDPNEGVDPNPGEELFTDIDPNSGTGPNLEPGIPEDPNLAGNPNFNDDIGGFQPVIFVPPGLPPIPIYDRDTGIELVTIIGEGIDVAIPIPPNGTFTTPSIVSSDPSVIETDPDTVLTDLPGNTPGTVIVGDIIGATPTNTDLTDGITGDFTDGGVFVEDGSDDSLGLLTPGTPGIGFSAIDGGTGFNGIGNNPISGTGNNGAGDTNLSPTVGGQPVDVVIDGFFIADGGANYSPGDEIVMIPSNGVEAEPVFNNVGQLVSINIQNPGGSFFGIPRIFIRSQTGVNANIKPIFAVRPENADPDERLSNITGDRIISVVDCVGHLPRPLQR